jgi:tetratricopeptide (TPR) repeat protein
MLKYLLVLFSLCGFSQQKKMDSLFLVFKGNQHDTIRLAALNELAIAALPPENDIYNNQLITLAKAKLEQAKPNSLLHKRYLSLLIESYYNKAVFLSDRSQKDSAILYYDTCEVLDVNSENTETVGYCQISKGGILTNRGLYKEAIALFYKALKAFEKEKNNEGIGDTYMYIGRLYHVQQNYGAAIDYLEKAYDKFKSINNLDLMLDALNKIGIAYISCKNYDKAISYFNECIDCTFLCIKIKL